MPALCSACGSAIAIEDINVQRDTAVCRRCGYATSYSAIVHAPVASLYTAPPEGCHIDILGERWRVMASTRNWMFFPTLGFTLVWNAFLAVFVIGMFKNPKGTPCIAFLSLHFAAGIYMIVQTLCYAIGHVEAVIESDVLTLSTGIGPLCWRRRRWLADIRGVREDTQRAKVGMRGSMATYLILDGPEPLKFGSQLNDTRRQFMHAAIAGRIHASMSETPR